MDDITLLISQIDACINTSEEAGNVERLEWIRGLLVQHVADESEGGDRTSAV